MVNWLVGRRLGFANEGGRSDLLCVTLKSECATVQAVHVLPRWVVSTSRRIRHCRGLACVAAEPAPAIGMRRASGLANSRRGLIVFRVFRRE